MKKFIYITSILIGGLLGSYISLTYAKDATLFEKAGIYFLIFPTIINSCTKLCHKAITGKGEKNETLFVPTVHCAICWTTLLLYINIKLNFHFVLTLVLIVNIIVWVVLTIIAWKRKQEKLIAIK